MGKRRLIGKIVILMLGLAAVVILAANSDTIPVSTHKNGYRVVIDPGPAVATAARWEYRE